MSGELVLPSEDAVDVLLATLRVRLLEALSEGRAVHAHASAGMKSLTTEDGSFRLTLSIDPRCEGRCEGRYPVPTQREEPFEVTYRCSKPAGHAGPHGAPSQSRVETSQHFPEQNKPAK